MTLSQLLNQINSATDIETFAKDNLLKIAISGDGRYILNYNEQQLGTPKSWISHYCRGLTLAGEPNNYQIIAKSFNRFYNIGEEPEYLNGGEQIDWDKPFEVQFKYDGSLILMYKWNNQICINTRGSFADSNVSSVSNKTWKQLFKEAEKTDLSPTLDYFPGVTYIYELCSPYNQVVEYYPDTFAKVLGAVYTDGTEISHTFEGEVYSCHNKEEVFELLKTLNPTQEGFVIAQWNGQEYTRRKCKTKTWVELSHLKDSVLNTDSKLWNVVFSGDLDEVSSVFPHLKEKLLEKQSFYKEKVEEINKIFNSIKHIENQKDFAILATKYNFSGVLFRARKENKVELSFIQEFITKTYV